MTARKHPLNIRVPHVKEHPQKKHTKARGSSLNTQRLTNAIIKSFHKAVLEIGKKRKQIHPSIKRQSICNCLKFRENTQDMEISPFFVLLKEGFFCKPLLLDSSL